MLREDSKSTQMLLTKQGYSLYTHSHRVLWNIAEQFNSVPGEHRRAGKTTPSPGPSEITQNSKQMVNPAELPTLKALVRLLSHLLRKDYLDSVLEQRHTSTLTLKNHLNNGELFHVLCLKHCHSTSLIYSSSHACVHLCVTFIPLKEHFQWRVIVPHPFRPPLELPSTAFRFVVQTSFLPCLYSS